MPIPTSLRSRLPFLVAAFLSFLLSVWLYFVSDETSAGIFVGLWVPSILSLGGLLHAPAGSFAVASAAPRERSGSIR